MTDVVCMLVFAVGRDALRVDSDVDDLLVLDASGL